MYNNLRRSWPIIVLDIKYSLLAVKEVINDLMSAKKNKNGKQLNILYVFKFLYCFSLNFCVEI